MDGPNWNRRFSRSPPRVGSRPLNCRDQATVSTATASSLSGIERADSELAQSVAIARDGDEIMVRSHRLLFDTRGRRTLFHSANERVNSKVLAIGKFGGNRGTSGGGAPERDLHTADGIANFANSNGLFTLNDACGVASLR